MQFLISNVSGNRAKLRMSFLLVACALTLPPAFADEPTGNAQTDDLPTLEDLEQPSFDELMNDDLYDWIVLSDGRVIVAKPVYPRPDTLEKIAEERTQLQKTMNQGPVDQRREARQRYEDLAKLEVELVSDFAQDYELPIKQVAQVINFEHLMLRGIDKLLDDGEIVKAYELIRQLEKMVPDWAKTFPRFSRLLFREAEFKYKDGDPYGALALLGELATRTKDVENPDPKISATMGSISSELIEAAIKNGDYHQARSMLARLARSYPQHPVYTKWNDRLSGQGARLLAQAEQLSSEGKHAEAAATALEANRVSRITGNSRSIFSKLALRYQTLRVPVTEFPGDPNILPIDTAADERHRKLTEVAMFEASKVSEFTFYQSSVFDVYDPRDLGREVLFTVRQTVPYWQSQTPTTANEIADNLSRMVDPDSDDFNPRMASFIKKFSARSPSQLHVSFRRVPLNLEALFRFSLASPADAEGKRTVLTPRFQLAEANSDTRIYRRSVPEPDGLISTNYHVAEIVEKKYKDRHEIIQAFTRGHVDMIPHLLPWEIPIFRKAGIASIQKYALPQNHLLVFNPRSEAVKGSQLRRALSFGIDREKLLEVVILRDPEMRDGRVSSAPWHSLSYASNPTVDPPAYDHYRSFLLRLTAQEQLRLPAKQEFVAAQKEATLKAKEDWDEEVFRAEHADEIKAAGEHIKLPKLRMLVVNDAVAQLAAEQMVERWKLLGFEVEIIPADRPEGPVTDDDWDLMYRVSRVEEPLLDLWSLLLTDNSFDVDKLSLYPDWMRQELINLDYCTSFREARERLYTIHRHMVSQAFLIPLYELDDYAAIHYRVVGVPNRPSSLYDGIERWVVKPEQRILGP